PPQRQRHHRVAGLVVGGGLVVLLLHPLSLSDRGRPTNALPSSRDFLPRPGFSSLLPRASPPRPSRQTVRPPRWRSSPPLLAALTILLLLTGHTAGQPLRPDARARAEQAPAPFSLPAGWLKALTWRSIGPANMGGRIVALAVYEADPSTYW